MDRLLPFIFDSFVQSGTLRVTTARGRTFTLGDGTGTPIAVRFTSRGAQWAVLLDPELRLGEAYMNGTFVIEQGSIADLLALTMASDAWNTPSSWLRPHWLIRYVWRRLQQFNPHRRARRNVAHHYDLDASLYSLFLDADRQYSCAYFENLDQSLDDAQLAKKRHLAAKLLIGPQQRVLDIGSGWGGLALYLAETCGARVTGITLSAEQLTHSRARAGERGLSRAVEFRLEDYRDVAGTFDRIVSVGMFEHVGVGFYDAYFRNAPSFSLRTASCCCIRSAGRKARPPPIRSSPNTSFRAATSLPFPKCCRRSSAPGCW